MKRILVLIMTALFLVPAAFAGSSNRSIIRIRLSDGSPLLITVNGREFKKIGRSITLGDLPGKRQNIQVYRYRPYADGKGGKAELAFSGKIKIEKGYTYDCIVDLGTGKFRMRHVSSLPELPSSDMIDPSQSHVVDQNRVVDNTPLELPVTTEVSTKLLPLKSSMAAVDADSKKLQLATNYINQNAVNTQDVTNIAGWIFFDDNRMKFVKQAYSKVVDKNNFDAVGKVFTLDDSKKEFNDFIAKHQ
jgi:hypothetical protein